MTDKFDNYYAAQVWFEKGQDIYLSSRQRAFELMTAKICETMSVERIEIWLYTSGRDELTEEVSYTKEGPITRGEKLRRSDYPIYFSSLDEERYQSSPDALRDPRLKEFLEGDLRPHNLCSILEAPIFSDGRMIGVVCCATSSGIRQWDHQDKIFLSICADFFGRMIESEKRHSYESDLRHKIDFLESDLSKRLEDLKDAKLSLDLALDAAQAAKWAWDLVTNRLDLSKTWYTRLGYEYNELPQVMSTFENAVHPEDLPKVHQEFQRYISGEAPIYEARFRMICKNGDLQWCLDRGVITHRAVDGKPLRMTGVNVNITPIVQLEQNLLTSKEQLKAMIESLPTPVAMFDRQFRYLAFSSRWKEEWRKFGEVHEGGGIEGNIATFRREWLLKMEEALLENRTLSRDDDFTQITPDTALWLRWVIQPWKQSDGLIGGVIVMAEDITNRKEAEMRLTQSSKLTALGEMAGGIAHEINNPLSIIKGYVDLLKRHSGRNSLTQELMLQYIEKMDKTVGRISKIVNGMRRFSRETSHDEKSAYSLNRIIDETLDICLERMNNNGTNVKVKRFQHDAIIKCRSVEISQVLLNLINNSFQAIAEQPHPWIEIRCEETSAFYRILIIDSGLGIPSPVRQKIFQPFFTTKDIGVGTGLGLSISRGIIQDHQGSLYYQDDAPHTTFVIELPKA